MLKMQRVAPQIKAIQEKYKKYSLRDPRKAEMNVEVSALYKKEGVNPAGGCLPLIIQMPFLLAYYRMLGVALDLRHANWGWIHDLSAPDPWHILPIAIVVTMFFMQRLTPQAGMDPAQQKMMNFFMPAMLGYISLTLARRASVCTGRWENLISLVQQSVMNRTALGREMREMMEEARKKERQVTDHSATACKRTRIRPIGIRIRACLQACRNSCVRRAPLGAEAGNQSHYWLLTIRGPQPAAKRRKNTAHGGSRG